MELILELIERYGLLVGVGLALLIFGSQSFAKTLFARERFCCLQQRVTGHTARTANQFASEGMRAVVLNEQAHAKYVERRLTTDPPTVARTVDGRLLAEEEFTHAAPADARTPEQMLLENLEDSTSLRPKRYLVPVGEARVSRRCLPDYFGKPTVGSAFAKTHQRRGCFMTLHSAQG